MIKTKELNPYFKLLIQFLKITNAVSQLGKHPVPYSFSLFLTTIKATDGAFRKSHSDFLESHLL